MIKHGGNQLLLVLRDILNQTYSIGYFPNAWKHENQISIYLSIYLSVSMISICLSIDLSVSTYLSVYLSIYLPTYLSFYSSIYLSVYLSVCLYKVLEVMVGHWSLTVITAFVTAKKLHSMITMTTNN